MRGVSLLRRPLVASHGARSFHGSVFVWADKPIPGGRGAPRAPQPGDDARFEDAPATPPRVAQAGTRDVSGALPRSYDADRRSAGRGAPAGAGRGAPFGGMGRGAPRVQRPPMDFQSQLPPATGRGRPSFGNAPRDASSGPPSEPHWSAPPPRSAPPRGPSPPGSPSSAPRWGAALPGAGFGRGVGAADPQYHSLAQRPVRPFYQPPEVAPVFGRSQQQLQQQQKPQRLLSTDVDEEELDELVEEDDDEPLVPVPPPEPEGPALPDIEDDSVLDSERGPRFAERKKTYPKEKIVRTPKPVPVFVRDPDLANDESLVRLTKKQRAPRVSAGRGQGAFDARQWLESRGGVPDALRDFSLAAMSGRGRGVGAVPDAAAAGAARAKPAPIAAPDRRSRAASSSGPRRMTGLDKRMQAAAGGSGEDGQDAEAMSDDSDRFRFETIVLVDKVVMPEHLQGVEFQKARKRRAVKLRERMAKLEAKRAPKDVAAARTRSLRASASHSWEGTRVRPNAEPQVAASSLADAIMGNSGWSVDDRVELVRGLAELEANFAKNGYFGHETDRQIDRLLDEF